MINQRNSLHSKSNQFVSAKVLQQVAAHILPFYQAIAYNRSFSRQWTRAILKTDLDRMQKMLYHISPSLGKLGLGSNAIGYFISFSFPKPINLYTTGITIPPGSVQFFFETNVHRALARSLIPFYQKLATNRTYAYSLAKAIQANHRFAVNRMVRQLIKSPALESVTIQSSGIALTFKFPFSKYPYHFYLFREVY